jgi:hypothetical protein
MVLVQRPLARRRDHVVLRQRRLRQQHRRVVGQLGPARRVLIRHDRQVARHPVGPVRPQLRRPVDLGLRQLELVHRPRVHQHWRSHRHLGPVLLHIQLHARRLARVRVAHDHRVRHHRVIVVHRPREERAAQRARRQLRQLALRRALPRVARLVRPAGHRRLELAAVRRAGLAALRVGAHRLARHAEGHHAALPLQTRLVARARRSRSPRCSRPRTAPPSPRRCTRAAPPARTHSRSSCSRPRRCCWPSAPPSSCSPGPSGRHSDRRSPGSSAPSPRSARWSPSRSPRSPLSSSSASRSGRPCRCPPSSPPPPVLAPPVSPAVPPPHATSSPTLTHAM